MGEEKAAAPVVYAGYPFAAGYPYAGLGHLGYPYAVPHVVPATHEVTYKTVTPTVETNVVATNAAVPVAVGGYKAVAGDNGDLKGAVHEVPALFAAPALDTQENSNGGALTVGTSAVVKYSLSKREAEADPAIVYSAALPYAAYHYGAYPYAYGAYAPYAYFG